MPSGRFETETAIRNAREIAPPVASPMPRMSDSGMPSRSVPRKMAVPEPPAASPGAIAFLCSPPCRVERAHSLDGRIRTATTARSFMPLPPVNTRLDEPAVLGGG